MAGGVRPILPGPLQFFPYGVSHPPGHLSVGSDLRMGKSGSLSTPCSCFSLNSFCLRTSWWRSRSLGKGGCHHPSLSLGRIHSVAPTGHGAWPTQMRDIQRNQGKPAAVMFTPRCQTRMESIYNSLARLGGNRGSKERKKEDKGRKQMWMGREGRGAWEAAGQAARC